MTHAATEPMPPKSRNRSAARLAALFCVAVAMGACETASDIADAANPFNWFSGEDDARSQRAAEGGGREGYPNLGSVPERPAPPTLEETRAQVREGLVADTENVRHADERIRREAERRAVAPNVSSSIASPPRAATSSASPPAEQEVPAAPPPPRAVPAAPAPAPAETAMGGDDVVVREYSAPRQPPGQAAPAPQSPAPRGVNETQIPAPPPPAPPQVVPSQAAPNTPPPTLPSGPTQVATIYFPDGGSTLKPLDLNVLSQVAALRQQAGGTLRVVGHSSGRASVTDPARRERVNYRMSMQRARTVADALIRQGVPPQAVTVEAKGADEPRYAETAPSGEAGNQRTEIILVY